MTRRLPIDSSLTGSVLAVIVMVMVVVDLQKKAEII
jgi:hypothetical protein